jgi:hypothetical protein
MKGAFFTSHLLLSIFCFSQSSENTYHTGVTFKVQIGAFSKSKPQIFDDIDSLSTYVMPNSLTKYLSGEFKTYEEALNHKKELLDKRYLGTFIVCFKEGMIIPISSLNIRVNQTMVHLLNDIKVVSDELKKEAFLNNQNAIDRIEHKSKRYNQLNPKIMFYRIQIGSYKKEVPLEVMEKFNQLKDLIFMYEGNKGEITYTTGKFQNSDQAYEHLKSLESIQFKGLQIIGIHDKQVIPYSVSKKLMKK